MGDLEAERGASDGVERATRRRRVILRLARAVNESASSEELTPTRAAVPGTPSGAHR